MLWIDFVIIAIILVCAVTGFVRGLFIEILNFTLWVFAIGIGLTFSQEFAILLTLTVVHASVRIVLSFTGLVWLTLVIGQAICSLLVEWLRIDIGLFNRFLALILGSLRGVLIMTVITLLAGLSTLPQEVWWHNAVLLPPFQAFALFLRDNVPTEMASYVNYP